MSSNGESRPVSTSSYLTGAISSLSNWSSRSPTPKPSKEDDDHSSQNATDRLHPQRGRDHSVSHTHRLSWRKYPQDCPKLEVRWFHAVDVPKRKPEYAQSNKDGKISPAPKKWSPFSLKDSRSLEDAFQKLLEEDERAEQEHLLAETGLEGQRASSNPSMTHHRSESNTTVQSLKESPVKVPVNEDYLFDVEIRSRELGPAYWLGPIYEVRRGSWFYVDGSTQRPCEENLAAQLEEGYLKTKPWRVDLAEGLVSQLPTKANDGSLAEKDPAVEKDARQAGNSSNTQHQLLTHRLFGKYINTVVTYQDHATAWLLSDDFLSRMSSTVYQRFAGGAHFSGTKVVRGHSESPKKKTVKEEKHAMSRFTTEDAGSNVLEASKRRSIPPSTISEQRADVASDESSEQRPETRRQTLERQMSSLVAASADAETLDEEAREREMREIRDEYKENPDEEQDREVDHLILCTHGIGQRLGVRFETFNFIQDVNALRKTMKTVYSASPDLQALNSEVDEVTKNCRVQVIPISWRHQLDFPMEGVKQRRKEHDIADLDADEQEKYPSLEDITVEGVPALRTIISDLALDVLLYQTAAYNRHVSKVVLNECNRIYRLFKDRNPTFKGKISLVGHSLGSAIMFDILCEQANTGLQEHITKTKSSKRSDLSFDFDVDTFFCFGSPIGLFQMLNGRKIAGRTNVVTLDGFTDAVEDPFQNSPYSKMAASRKANEQSEALISSPKCGHMYNIFHPTDPISYRLEPLISPEMATLKPQPLPYTKKNFFGPMGQGITGIPAKVGQSFSGLWQGFRSGLADSFIQKSLGITPEDAGRLSNAQAIQPINSLADTSTQDRQTKAFHSAGAGTNIVSGGVLSPDHQVRQELSAESGDEKKRRLMKDALNTDPGAFKQPTLIDSEIETLYSGFQKRRRSGQENDANLRDFGEHPAWQEAEMRSRKLKREEAKVRAVNSNGRVDYSIQEGAFDISFLASIASHLTYWTDEDVCHFMMSQLLSRRRPLRKAQSAGNLHQRKHK